ncbi:MAG: NUDIX hydrolase [Pseudomonadota bacterium]
MTWKPHVTVAAVVPDGNRYLFVEERVRGRQVINQPAGHLEVHESLVEAVQRETLEESGYEIRAEACIGIYRWQAPDSDHVILRFAFAGTVLAERHPAPPDPTVDGRLWLTRAELEDARDRHRSRMVLGNVLDYEAGRRFPLELLHEIPGTEGSTALGELP